MTSKMDMDPQDRIQKNYEAFSSGDEDGEDEKNSFKVPIPPKPPPFVIAKEKDLRDEFKVCIPKLFLILAIFYLPSELDH